MNEGAHLLPIFRLVGNHIINFLIIFIAAAAVAPTVK
jgi:hypothetical protein